MIAAGRGRIVNISMNHATMRRRGFSPYGPSKAALESETIIWAQDLDGTGVTVNALLPGGATATGMIPDGLPQEARTKLLDPAIVIPPLLWLASEASDGVTGRRIDASRWRGELSEAEAAEAATDDAGWAIACHLDEVYLKINGELFYLWRAADQHGVVLDILVQ
jgi:NAD(P)-dependent dehydrogenase (short-subunit alcohol dehydrogenase family)